MKTTGRIFTGIVIAGIAFLMIFTSCSTERIEPKEELEEYEKADEYLESKKVEEQEYEITEDGEGPLIGKEGTKLWLSNDVLEYPNGDSVHFPYTIKLVELYSAKDMINYQMPSMSGDNLLTTHGEIRVRAFKDGIELVLRSEKFWIVEIPNSKPKTDMLCYYGSENNTIVDWLDNKDTSFDIIASGYHGEIVSLGWISCAQSGLDSEQTISYSFYSDTISLQNLTSFIYIPEIEGLMQVYSQVSAPLPLGETIKIISLGKQGEQLYSFYFEGVVSELSQVEIVLSSTTDAEYADVIDNL